MEQGKVAGGSFLVEPASPDALFTPEALSEEHRMIARTAKGFVENEVVPRMEEIEQQKEGLMVQLLRKAGELGLLAHSIPVSYGGLGLDKITKGVVGEALGRSGSYGVAHSNHTCIATLPITYFGTEQQKATYLPKLASGEYLGAYCLTEPTSGSDALGIKTTAVLTEDGSHYLLNGTKQWITNAGFAQTFIVYAKVNGSQFTAFIVEKDFPGLSLGPEEKKMGIHGSSTRSVYLEDCRVPVENVLGEVGKGHLIAFTVLNLGRFNLGFACTGSAKLALELALSYTKERRQFNRSLASFAATQEKIAVMASRVFAAESLHYRTAGLLENVLADVDKETDPANVVAALSEYAIECAACKVFGSETLDQVVDEVLQLHGGYGFMRDYRIEQMYRDSRINRIFEGTNEINRLLIPDFLFKKSGKGQLALEVAIEQAQAEWKSGGTLSEGQGITSIIRRWFLVMCGLAREAYGSGLNSRQEVLMKLADLGIILYAVESAELRADKLGWMGRSAELARTFAEEALVQSEGIVRRLIGLLANDRQVESDMLTMLQKDAGQYHLAGMAEQRKKLAEELTQLGEYAVN
ncbi:acyl-CoA dehydrogenase family protein [Laceyella putida]|uniref:Acyl-CoA dehydrogenase family protein n=1 Tax=Laceyella putida TaxID=110101 RepID=A0ABW2RME6_9BACL